ncbi:lipopolysaccharide biosynthesis protein [Bifidobacterium samirii]|nr:lipopolysaccharide biosynthesis protein [Bifidobacterium samirii]
MTATIIAFLVQIGVNFILTPYILATLGAEAYGFVPLVNTLVGYSSLLTGVLNAMAGRFIGLAYGQGDHERANVYFSSVMIADAALAVILAVPYALAAAFPQAVMDVPPALVDDVRWTFMLSAAGMEISLLTSVYGVVYYVSDRLDRSAVRGIEGNLLRAGVLVALFATMRPHICFVAGSALAMNVYQCLANVYYTRRLTPELRVRRSSFRWQAVRELTASGLWNSVNTLSYALLVSLDLYLANRFLGAAMAGRYSVARTMPQFVTNVAQTLVGVLGPSILHCYAQGRMGDMARSLHRSIRLMGLAVSLPAGYLIVFGQEFFRLWAPTEDPLPLQAMSVVPLVAMVVSGCTMPVSNVYIAMDRVRVPSLIFLACGVANVAVVLPLLAWTDLGIWAIIGVAAAMDIAKNLILSPMYAARCAGMPRRRMLAAECRGLAGLPIMIAVCCACRTLVAVDSWPAFVAAAGACALVAGSVGLIVATDRRERAAFAGKAVRWARVRIVGGGNDGR